MKKIFYLLVLSVTVFYVDTHLLQTDNNHQIAQQAAIKTEDATVAKEYPATCFAPGTDPHIVEAFYQNRENNNNSLDSQGSRFNLAPRWSETATDGGGLGQGDLTTLTWSYVPNGTPIGNGGCGLPDAGNFSSDFITFFNGIYGPPTVPGDFTTAPWHNVFVDMFNSWSEVSGLIFVYEPNDDGSTVVFNPGELGVRGDIRISGHLVDGNNGVLACNYFPNNGDMIIDTGDNFFINNPGLGTINVLTHEIGHGLGIEHVCPINETKLMEPFVTFAFQGPQEDDILATNRSYGDPDGVNDTQANAVFLGGNTNPTSYVRTQRSIDDNSEVDYFSFSINEPTDVSVELTPTGSTYLEGVQNNNGSCSPGTNFNARVISNLKVELLDTNGTTVIAAAQGNGPGINENITNEILIPSGTYFVRVSQEGTPVDNVQMYDLELNLITAIVDTPPTAICTDFTVSLDSDGNGSIVPTDIDNGSSDGQGPVTLSLDIDTFDCSNLGENTVTLTVTDNSSQTSSCTATVTVIDTIAPQANCQNITVQLDATGNATIIPDEINNNSTDNCAITNVMLDVSSFTCADLGENMVTLTVTDASNNSDSCMATVTVVENTTPTAVCQDITVPLDTNGLVNITVDQIDNGSFLGCNSDNVNISLDITSFDCSNLGVNPVTLTVDNNGETSSCTANVTVVDNIAPEAICQNITLVLDDTGNATITPELIDNNSTDNCGIDSFAIDITTFDCSTIGENTVTLTVFDTSGNTSSCTSIVTVVDTSMPTAICQDLTVALDNNGQATITAEQIDNGSFLVCDSSLLELSIDIAAFDCSNIGPNTVTLTAQGNGATSSCTAVVTIIDSTPPVANCQDLVIQLDATGNASISAEDINDNSFDNCGIESVVIDITDFTCDNLGSNTVTLTVTDENGNSSECESTVIIEGFPVPTAICQDASITLNTTGTTAIDPSLIDGGSFDSCGGTDIELTVSPSFIDCDDIGETEVTLTVTSAEGGISQCTAIVTVVAPIVQPEAICQNITVTLDENGIATITPSAVDGGSTALFCGGGLTIDVDTFTCDDAGTSVPVTLTATNENNFTDSCTANVFVVDTIDPIINCPEETLIIAALAPFELPDYSQTGDVIITDNCSTEVEYQQDPPAGTLVEEGTTTITVVVTDPSGNSISCSFDIFVDPSLSIPSEIASLATIDLYPNPNDGIIYISNPNEIALQQVKLYDITGRLVKQWGLSDVVNRYTINLEDVASASYFLIIESELSNKTFQVLKK